jgi:D-cysteine desulfhydrase
MATTTTTEASPGAALPLLRRFPSLAALPRASLGRFPSPVMPLAPAALDDARADAEPTLWVKRDDLNAPVAAGNKVRALEFLLGSVRMGDTVLTLGGEGSTHVLATAAHARRLGARTIAVRWRHDMHDAARTVARRSAELCAETVSVRGGAVSGVVVAHVLRRRRRGGRLHFVPIGGSTPLGTLGHVNAALELAEQVDAGELPPPRRVVVPYGSGGTAAGLALGFAIAGLRTIVTAVRVAPRAATNRWRLLLLARATRRLIARHERAPVRAERLRIEVVHAYYGGAYGRPLAVGGQAARIFQALGGPGLEATYSEKAFAAAIDLARDEGGPVLFWLTFDARMLVR